MDWQGGPIEFHLEVVKVGILHGGAIMQLMLDTLGIDMLDNLEMWILTLG